MNYTGLSPLSHSLGGREVPSLDISRPTGMLASSREGTTQFSIRRMQHQTSLALRCTQINRFPAQMVSAKSNLHMFSTS